jgi:hypothetical protein
MCPRVFRRSLPVIIAVFAGWLPAENPPTPTAGDWKPLFDGRSFAGWTTKSGQPVTAGWEVRDGAIHRAGPGGDIVTSAEWKDFELEFEWKVAAKANSGLKYRVANYEPAGRDIGPEYQVLDDTGHPNGAHPKTSAGSLYDLVPPTAAKSLRPVGEWNQSRVVARGPRLEHWLNGEKVIDVNLESAEWRAALSASKFKAAGDFASKRGRILLQDHGDEAWFRALRIRELPGA